MASGAHQGGGGSHPAWRSCAGSRRSAPGWTCADRCGRRSRPSAPATAAVTLPRRPRQCSSSSQADCLSLIPAGNVTTDCRFQNDRYVPSPHTTRRRYLGIGWMLASGKHVDLIHHLRYIHAKGAEHQGKVPLLHSPQHSPLSRWSLKHIADQSQQEEDRAAHTSMILHNASWRFRLKIQCTISSCSWPACGECCLVQVHRPTA